MPETREIKRTCSAYVGPSDDAEVAFRDVAPGTVVEIVSDSSMPDDLFFAARYQGRRVYFSSSAAIEADETDVSAEAAAQPEQAPTAAFASADRVQSSSGKFERDKFLVNQKRMSFKEKYYVYGENEEELFYVERDFKFLGKRHIAVFDDDTKNSAVLHIDQEHRWEFGRREYTLCDAEGESIASFYRNNWKSLLRRSWDIFDRDGTLIAIAREDSAALAFLRRAIDFIPFVELLGGLIKTDFHLFRVNPQGGEEKIGSFNRRMTFADKYVMDLPGDPERTLDRRTAVALGILLDTAEKR